MMCFDHQYHFNDRRTVATIIYLAHETNGSSQTSNFDRLSADFARVTCRECVTKSDKFEFCL